MAEFTKEQLIDHITDMMESSKEMIDGNGVPVEFVVRAERDIAVYEIALAALTAEPEGGAHFARFDEEDDQIIDQCSKNQPDSFPLYRLPLLEGLK